MLAAAREVDRCAEPAAGRLMGAARAAGHLVATAAELSAAASRALSLFPAPAAAALVHRAAVRQVQARPQVVAHAVRLVGLEAAVPMGGVAEAVEVVAPDAEVVAEAPDAELAEAEVPGGVGVVEVSAARLAAQLWGPPSAVAWVFRQDRLLPGPVRRPSAPTGRAIALSLTAWPSTLWWRARLFVDLS
jgi:hypothetical protein